MLTVYEENNLHYYSEADATKWVVNDQSTVNLASECSNMLEQMKNPFVDLYHWIKGELYDLESFKSSLDCHKDAVNAHIELSKKLHQAKSDVENVSTGKKTMSTMFKNKDDVGSL